MNKQKLTVIDFFSGAGGFSEGFRQQGFEVIMGVDFWEPAVNTHNLNHGLSDKPKNVLDFEGENTEDVSEIDNLPSPDVLIGSPSCVSFSMSNRAGKADKSEGVRLIEAYLRVVAVKKHEEGSRLKAWLMENVPNSSKFVKESYTFKDLNLEKWAKDQGHDPAETALNLNGTILNASDYSAPQNRNRFICGELVGDGDFPLPELVGKNPTPLKAIKDSMPKPNMTNPKGVWQDPNYPNLRLPAKEISDHFYDTGLYITEWEQARHLKTMHSYMGKMSFPENEDKPSRTVTATRSASTRESLIYESERKRRGHGQYRLPTIREIASLMGYPYTYQFLGSEGVKWKLIGNSVSPQLSSALAKEILLRLGLSPVPMEDVSFYKQKELFKDIDNLNDFKEKKFDSPRSRKKGSRFRRSVHKSGNMTVDLLNHSPDNTSTKTAPWSVCAFYGTGSAHSYDIITTQIYRKVEKVLSSKYPFFDELIEEMGSMIEVKSLSSRGMQRAYEHDWNIADKHNPLVVINDIKRLVEKYSSLSYVGGIHLPGMRRGEFTLEQAMYLFILSYIIYNNFNSKPTMAREESLVYEL